MFAAVRADAALRDCFIKWGSPKPEDLTWADYQEMVRTITDSLSERPQPAWFDYIHPAHLQDAKVGLGKPYCTRLAYCDPGEQGEPVVAIGGITNVMQRFDFLRLDSAPVLRLIGLDLAGRGRSGWLAELTDYTLEAYVAQFIQLLDCLGLETCTVLGSSLGGSVAIVSAARYPERIKRIVLNDSGPFIPAARRARRARAVARHYVFSSPAEMFRRTGAASRHIGPAADSVLLHNAHSKTRWSEDEQGRVYRHDIRALLAYRAESEQSLDLWHEWDNVQCPVLLLHGMESDATTSDMIERMHRHPGLSVIHIPGTGHTPSLSDGHLAEEITQWIFDDRPFEQDRSCAGVSGTDRILFNHA